MNMFPNCGTRREEKRNHHPYDPNRSTHHFPNPDPCLPPIPSPPDLRLNRTPPPHHPPAPAPTSSSAAYDHRRHRPDHLLHRPPPSTPTTSDAALHPDHLCHSDATSPLFVTRRGDPTYDLHPPPPRGCRRQRSGTAPPSRAGRRGPPRVPRWPHR
ncbi:hypothetical protein ACQJBY_059183 [Aegilops geniculata]